jgi:hypothetical protein
MNAWIDVPRSSSWLLLIGACDNDGWPAACQWMDRERQKPRKQDNIITYHPRTYERTNERKNERTNASVRPFKRFHRRVMCAGAVDRKKASDFFFFVGLFCFFGGPSSALYFLVLVRNTVLRNKINKIKFGDFRGDFFVSFSRETQLIPSGDFF